MAMMRSGQGPSSRDDRTRTDAREHCRPGLTAGHERSPVASQPSSRTDRCDLRPPRRLSRGTTVTPAVRSPPATPSCSSSTPTVRCSTMIVSPRISSDTPRAYRRPGTAGALPGRLRSAASRAEYADCPAISRGISPGSARAHGLLLHGELSVGKPPLSELAGRTRTLSSVGPGGDPVRRARGLPATVKSEGRDCTRRWTATS